MADNSMIIIVVIAVILISGGFMAPAVVEEDEEDDTIDESLAGEDDVPDEDDIPDEDVTVDAETSSMSVFEGYIDVGGQAVIPGENEDGVLQSVYYGNVKIVNLFVLPVLSITYDTDNYDLVESVSVEYDMSLTRVGVYTIMDIFEYCEDTDLFGTGDYVDSVNKPLLDINGGELEMTDLLALAGRSAVMDGDGLEILLSDYISNLGYSVMFGSSYSFRLYFELSNLKIYYTLTNTTTGVFECDVVFNNILSIRMQTPAAEEIPTIITTTTTTTEFPTTTTTTTTTNTGTKPTTTGTVVVDDVDVSFSIFWTDSGESSITGTVLVGAGVMVLILGGFWYKNNGMSVKARSGKLRSKKTRR